MGPPCLFGHVHAALPKFHHCMCLGLLHVQYPMWYTVLVLVWCCCSRTLHITRYKSIQSSIQHTRAYDTSMMRDETWTWSDSKMTRTDSHSNEFIPQNLYILEPLSGMPFLCCLSVPSCLCSSCISLSMSCHFCQWAVMCNCTQTTLDGRFAPLKKSFCSQNSTAKVQYKTVKAGILSLWNNELGLKKEEGY